MYQLQKKESAFTLVELAIVLVIVGLLIGGVLVGQSLIKSAQQNKQIKELVLIKSAMMQFRDKYKAVPGDFSKATILLNSNGATLANGNGDGYVGNYILGQTFTGEVKQTFVHLVASDFYPNLTATGITSIKGVDFPKNPVSDTGSIIISAKVWNSSENGYFQPSLASMGEGHYLWPNIGNEDITSSQSWNWSGPESICRNSTVGFTQEDLLAIDTKIDDGKSMYGTMYAPYAFGNCAIDPTYNYCHWRPDYYPAETRKCFFVYKLLDF